MRACPMSMIWRPEGYNLLVFQDSLEVFSVLYIYSDKVTGFNELRR